jgi:hypothetical protein
VRLLVCLLAAGCAGASRRDEVRAAYNDSFCAHYKTTRERAVALAADAFRAEGAREVAADGAFVYAEWPDAAAGAWIREHDDGVIVSIVVRGPSPHAREEELHRRLARGLRE